MSDLHPSSVGPRIPRRLALVSLLAAAGVIVLPSCGGGGADAVVGGLDTGGTGSFSAGRISGFGSVIVNGVRFEDNAARITDDDGATLRTDDLKLGMVVRVQAGAVTAGSGDTLPSAAASAIVVESQIKGTVESKTAPDTLVVFGQTVKVNAATVFEGVVFDTVTVGDILEVSGFADAAGVVTATRIEREATANEFKLRGVIANLDAVAPKTFQIGAASFDYSDPAVRLPATGLANGMFVRVRTQTARNGAGRWMVTRIDLREAVDDRGEGKLEGILVRNGTALQVNGVTIDTSALPAGTLLPEGRQVEVEGTLANGVLVARKIEVEDEGAQTDVDVRGTASSVDTSAQTFVVRGLTFHYTGATRQDHGTIAANLANGAAIRVRGTLPAGGTGNIEATRIDFQP